MAPRPLPDEILSSWLLRVAAANGVSLEALLDGFDSQYPGVLRAAGILDCAPPHRTLMALAKFCRVSVTALRELDLQLRAPHLEPRLLLRFPLSGPSPCWLRGRVYRARYAHCPVCLDAQDVPHVRWDWCFVGLNRCSVHRVELREGCTACGEVDPLHFSPPRESDSARCWSCGSSLGAGLGADHEARPGEFEDAVDAAYRAALRGIAPEATLLGTASSREFQRFINDLLEFLGGCVKQPPSDPKTGWITRQDLLKITAALIRTAGSTPIARERRARLARALILWGTLLKLLNPAEGADLLRMSVRWPRAIRRRLNSAMLRHRRRRWPNAPFPTTPICLGFKCHTLSVVYELGAANSPQGALSRV